MKSKWDMFLAVLLFTGFLVICNYGPLINIFIWIIYGAGKVDDNRSSDDNVFFLFIGIIVVINVILTAIFWSNWGK